jgi:hypothetical protein
VVPPSGVPELLQATNASAKAGSINFRTFKEGNFMGDLRVAVPAAEEYLQLQEKGKLAAVAVYGPQKPASGAVFW